jgi:hypothetical protein
LEQASQDNSIQGYSDGVFWERNTLSLQKENGKKTPKTSSLELSLFEAGTQALKNY